MTGVQLTHVAHVARRTRVAAYMLALLGATLLASSCAPGLVSVRSGAARPLTRAERTAYAETSRYEDVIAFLDALRTRGAPLAFGTMGQTSEGRAIPYVIASRPLVRTAAEARASGRPIVLVQGNIHAGEVEGKEALLALLRDLALEQRPNVLDSIILVAVPIYNADGNEKVGPQDRQRSEQNGPELVGQRPNAQGLDLNRDYVKAESPETRASLAMFNAWDPHVFVDLHTTDGSFHGYALTYAPSLHPAAPLGEFTRELLGIVRQRMRARHGIETFDYGNFNDRDGLEVSTDSTHAGWFTYDHRPRFGTNYYGLRNRVSVLSEAFSHDPLERRVRVTSRFVRELLSIVAERSSDLVARERAADAALAAPGTVVALRSALPSSAPVQPVRFELLMRTGDSTLTEPGVPRGLRRTGVMRTSTMPVFDRFVPVLSGPLPALYLVPDDPSLVARLVAHGIAVDAAQPLTRLGTIEEFMVDSIVHAARPFQGHREVRFAGHWQPIGTGAAPAVGRVVRTGQPRGRLAALLLDPESDDGLATWNAFDALLRTGAPFPVRRVMMVP